MNKLFILLLMVAGMACRKTASETDPAAASGNNGNGSLPVAAFKISNMVNGAVGEGKILVLKNTSTASGVTYSWDFGNGTVSTAHTPEFYFNMHGNYTIVLTVKDQNGRTATAVQSVSVLCGRVDPNHDPLAGPVI